MNTTGSFFPTFSNKRGTLFVIMKVNGNDNGTSGFGTFISTYKGTDVDWQFDSYGTSSYAYYNGTGNTNIPFATSPPNDWGILTLNRQYDDTISIYKMVYLQQKR